MVRFGMSHLQKKVSKWATHSLFEMELKLMLAHIILDYEVSYPPGITSRPKNILFNGAIVPDQKAHLVFKRRSTIDLGVVLPASG